MKPTLKRVFLFSGIALGCVAMTVAATMGIRNGFLPYKAQAGSYVLELNGTNAPAGLTNSYKDSFTTTATTADGNSLGLSFVMVKASAGNYVDLAHRGSMYNFGVDSGRITGITKITANLESGSLTLKTSNSELANGGAYLGTDVDLPNGGDGYTLPNPARYFELQAGDSGAVITSLFIEYSCDGSPTPAPSGTVFNVENFESYDGTGDGWDTYGTGHARTNTSKLRSAFLSTYHNTHTDPSDGRNWIIMGSSDYITYKDTLGRNGSKTGLFKAGSGNNFCYVQMKGYNGINSVIGKGARLSMWIHDAYTTTDATAAYGYDLPIKIAAFYNAKYSRTSTNGASVASYTVPHGSGWNEITIDLDPAKEYYAFGFAFTKTASGNCYVPIDDITIYTTSPYPSIPVTGISISDSSATIKKGSTKQLTATLTPFNPTTKGITWTSSNSSIASVDSNGLVTGVFEGNATITAKSVDGNYTATCNVTVEKVYPGGTYFKTITVSGISMNVHIVLSTRTEAKVWIYGSSAGTCEFVSYDESTGAFTISTTGTAKVAGKTYTFGNITGYYRNDQLEEVRLNGTISSLVTSSYTIPHPTYNYWDCEGTTAELQSIFKRRYMSGSWQVDSGNTDRITADSAHATSGLTGAKLRGYTGGAAINLQADIYSTSDHNLGFWIYNPKQSALTIRVWIYTTANFANNSELTSRSIPAQSWYYFTEGYDNKTVYNFGITTLGANSDASITVDDICIYK